MLEFGKTHRFATLGVCHVATYGGEWANADGVREDGVSSIDLGGRQLDVGLAVSFETKHGVAGTCIVAPRIVKFVSVCAPKGDYRLQFWKGLVYKATAVATLDSGLTLVSFHGYNGTFQGRQVQDLLDHVAAVIAALPPNGPVLFGGDFNTFTAEHVEALEACMGAAGFECHIRVPYDSKKTLDFVFTRQCTAALVDSGSHESDHPFILCDVEF